MIAANACAPWVGPGLTERLKYEAIEEAREREKQEKSKKIQRVLAWLRRSRW